MAEQTSTQDILDYSPWATTSTKSQSSVKKLRSSPVHLTELEPPARNEWTILKNSDMGSITTTLKGYHTDELSSPVKFNSHRLRKGGMTAEDWEQAGRKDSSPSNPINSTKNINNRKISSNTQTPVSVPTTHSRLNTKVLPEVSSTPEHSSTTFFTYRAHTGDEMYAISDTNYIFFAGCLSR
jgi:hypothetical protein